MLNLIRSSELDLAEAREQRAYLRRVIGLTLAAVAFLCLLALAIRYAHAEESKPQMTFVAHVGPNKLYLFPDACALGGWFAKWRKARWVMGRGESFEACWRLQDDAVRTVDAAGDTGSVPVQVFRRDEGI